MLGISVLMMPMDNNDNGTSTASGFLIQASGIIFAVTGFIDLVTTLSVSGKIKRWTSERRTTILGEDIYDEIIVDIQDDTDDK